MYRWEEYDQKALYAIYFTSDLTFGFIISPLNIKFNNILLIFALTEREISGTITSEVIIMNINVNNAFDYLTGKKTYSYSDSVSSATTAACEAIVMLENKNGCLPLSADKPLCIFGRMQKDYFISGTGKDR